MEIVFLVVTSLLLGGMTAIFAASLFSIASYIRRAAYTKK